MTRVTMMMTLTLLAFVATMAAMTILASDPLDRVSRHLPTSAS